MNISQFASGLQEELELDIELIPETMLSQLDEWDSMAAMIIIGYVGDNFGTILTGADIAKITSLNSLIDIIGRDKFD